MVDLARLVGSPGWLCTHGWSRDLCPCCDNNEEEDYDTMKKAELADLIRTWIASDGIEVGDTDRHTFRLRLPCDTRADGFQVYLISVTIPQDKHFALASDWQEHQSDTKAPEGEADDPEDD